MNVLQICLVALWAADSSQRTHLSLAAAVLALISTILFSVVSFKEHSCSKGPCETIQVFLLLTILLDLARVRTQWLLPDNLAIATSFSIAFGLRILWLVFESIPKHKYGVLLANDEDISPEELNGIISRSLFWWINPLLVLGYSKDLSMSDLFPVDSALSGPTTYERMHKVWLACKRAPSCITDANEAKHSLQVTKPESTLWPLHSQEHSVESYYS